jgi:hypothetical protein
VGVGCEGEGWECDGEDAEGEEGGEGSLLALSPLSSLSLFIPKTIPPIPGLDSPLPEVGFCHNRRDLQ